MKDILKKAWNEFACDFFIYDAILNIVLVLLFLAALAVDILLACNGSSLSLVVFNPLSLLMVIILGNFVYQYGELVFKYAELNQKL